MIYKKMFITTMSLVIGGIFVSLLSGCPGRQFDGGLKRIDGDYYLYPDLWLIAPNPRSSDSLIIPYAVVDYAGGAGFIVAARKNRPSSNDPLDYWILDTKRNRLFGPLSGEEYLAKRMEVGVPARIHLKEEPSN